MLRIRIRILLLTLIRILASKERLKTLKKCSFYIPYILACHLQIDADQGPDPAYHFDADPCGPGFATLNTWVGTLPVASC